MTSAEFLESLKEEKVPPGLSPELEALWYAGGKSWDTAHKMVQYQPDTDNAKIHAYLHREEGDLPNARYWYSRAEEKMPDCSLEEEYRKLVDYFTGKTSCLIDF